MSNNIYKLANKLCNKGFSTLNGYDSLSLSTEPMAAQAFSDVFGKTIGELNGYEEVALIYYNHRGDRIPAAWIVEKRGAMFMLIDETIMEQYSEGLGWAAVGCAYMYGLGSVIYDTFRSEDYGEMDFDYDEND